MIDYFVRLKTKKHIPGKELHLVGNNNWTYVKLVNGLILSISILVGILIFIYRDRLNDMVSSFSLIAMLSLFIFTFEKIVDRKQKKFLLKYLIFNEKGIQYLIENKKEKTIPIEDIKRLRVILLNHHERYPLIRIHLNEKSDPLFEFNYIYENLSNQEAAITELFDLINLKLKTDYQYSYFWKLLEYTKEDLLNQAQEIKYHNFFKKENNDSLRFTNKNDHQYYTSLDFRSGKLFAQTNLFYTFDIDLDKVLTFGKSIKVHKESSESEEKIINIIWLEDKNKVRNEILKSSLSLKDKPSEIFEYECAQELDSIVSRLNKIIK